MFAAIFLALALIFGTGSVATEVEQAPREVVAMSALEVSAWEIYHLDPAIAETADTQDTVVTYVSSGFVADGFRVEANQFHLIDSYDDAYYHIFQIDYVTHA